MQPLATSLIKATKNNDVEALKILSEDHALTGVDTREQTLLFYAVKAQSFKTLDFLLNEGLNVNQTNYQNETPLHIAARIGDVTSVQRLLDASADVRMSNHHKQTPLMLAAAKGAHEIIDVLLDSGASLNALDAMGDSVLFYALRGRKRSILNRFIDAGAWVHHLNDQQHSLVHEAATLGEVRLLEVILEAGVSPYTLNIHHQSPLHLATFKRHISMVERLLDLGLEPNLTDHFEESPIKTATRLMDQELMTLFEAFPRHQSVVAYRLKTPLHHAIRTGEIDRAMVLMKKHTFDPLYDTYGKSALFYAVIRQDAYLVNALIEAGHPTDAFQTHGLSLVMMSLLYKQSSLLDVLKSHQLLKDLSPLEKTYVEKHPALKNYLN